MPHTPISRKAPVTEKLQKILANAGLGSRRQMEEWVSAGRVSINGAIAKLGDRATSHDTIRVDGHPLTRHARPQKSNCRVLIYHKPEGEICSRSDPEGRITVFDRLPLLRNGRWIAIGRLDLNTSGLLLFTNDGEFANRMMHPSYEIEREYAVRILGKVDEKMLIQLQKGVRLSDGIARFEKILDAGGEGANHWYHVVLKEGRNREVRRLWESQAVKVSRLIRIRYANVSLPRTLKAGHWRQLEPKEVDEFVTTHPVARNVHFWPDLREK